VKVELVLGLWVQRKMVPKCELLKSIPLHVQKLKCEKNVSELEDYVGEDTLSLTCYTRRKHGFLTRKIDQKVAQMSPCSTSPKCHFGQIDLDPTILTWFLFTRFIYFLFIF